MKIVKSIVAISVVILIVIFITNCASTPKQEGTGEYVDDSVITTKVKSLFAADDFISSFQISVETYKGIVQLSGFVHSQEAIDTAGRIARSVKGVTAVRNDLIVK